MLVLSIDSAASGCGACVWHDGKVLAEAQEPMDRGQDRRLVPLVNDMMQKAGVGFSDLNRIAVTRGPGSFTGLRIGLAAARGFGLAASKPVIGIDRFAIYRNNIQLPNKSLLVVIDSRRKELFCRFYPARGFSMETLLMTAEEIVAYAERKGDTTVTGDTKPASVTDFITLGGKEVVLSASLAAAADPKNEHFLPRPLYIRPPDVTFASDTRRE